ncbi:MAG: hypothetical protein AAFV45_14915 [Pseudomonadota bacterium]
MRACIARLCQALLVVLLVAPTVAHSDDPDFLPGTDPGGIAIALIGAGIDYTDAKISSRLARDGEGTPIGWDFVDNNYKPFEGDSKAYSGGAAAALLSAYKKSRLIVVRVDTASPSSMAQALGMASKMPARIVAVPELSIADGPQMVTAIAARAPDRLFVVPAVLDSWPEPVPPNVVRVAPISDWDRYYGSGVDAWISAPGAGMFGSLIIQTDRPEGEKLALSVARAAASAACAQHGRSVPLDGGPARTAYLATGRPSKERPGVLVYDPLCLYGGKLMNQ